MNQHFVSIKVDREERPDVDRVYMKFVQATTGSGGWPMSVWLTPDLKRRFSLMDQYHISNPNTLAFMGGTYFPPEDSLGRPGFLSLLQHITDRWTSHKDKLMEAGTRVIHLLKDVLEVRKRKKK
jgi:uncharacterized protein YyaL (SSP411 family)